MTADGGKPAGWLADTCADTNARCTLIGAAALKDVLKSLVCLTLRRVRARDHGSRTRGCPWHALYTATCTPATMLSTLARSRGQGADEWSHGHACTCSRRPVALLKHGAGTRTAQAAAAMQRISGHQAAATPSLASASDSFPLALSPGPPLAAPPSCAHASSVGGCSSARAQSALR